MGKKLRRNMRSTLLNYPPSKLEGRDDIDTRRIFVTHTAMPEELVHDASSLSVSSRI